ncbi:MAG: glucose-6-phosphate isomerase [Steroidobacteraceae bacterium]
MSTSSWIDGPSVPAWRALGVAAESLAGTSIADLWSADAERAGRFIVEGAGLVLDFTRQRLDHAAFDLLCRLADEVKLRERIESMYRGELINNTENRAVLHTALRRQGAPFAKEVGNERQRMLDFAEGVRSGRIRGSTGEPFERVVNIGIGGSDLGPAMAVQALHQFAAGGPYIDFVSNVDGCRLADVLAVADPRRTLFIICSKTFTTLETRTNAETARRWLQAQLGEAAVPPHFAAVSVNAAAMDAFGVHPEHRFMMWDWVGGRYSLWSSIGVSLAIAVGPAHFRELLAGGAQVDEHFRSAAWAQNLPALMGLIGVWNINFLKLPTLAVLPYDDRLGRFPAYLQQLEMESNGKSVRRDGTAVACATAPVIWGEPGNNAQHSFFQMLHQGTLRAALDFLLPAISSCGDQNAQDLAIANCLAQAEAFAFGQASPLPQKVHEGNRPSSLVLFRKLDPAALGRLIALYEHKVFTQSVVWGINAFDQWGVELGKKLAESIAPLVAGQGPAQSASLAVSLAKVRELRQEDTLRS